MYQRICDELARQREPVTLLKQSFRSVPNIQRFVNAAFRDDMRRDATRCSPAMSSCGRIARTARPASGRGAAGTAPLRRCRGDAEEHRGRRCRRRSASSSSRWLVARQSGWQVTTAGGPPRPGFAPSDVCLLFRRFIEVSATTSRATTWRPWNPAPCRTCSSAARPFTSAKRLMRSGPRSPRSNGPRTSCRCLPRCAGRSLRSATKNCSSITRECGATRVSSLSRPERPADTPGPDRRGARLCCASSMRPQLPPGGRHHRATDRSDTCARRVHPLAGRRTGVGQRAAHWRARAAVRGEGGLSFRGFVETLRAAAAKAEAPEAPILEEGSEGVRLMTVHKAKGLEFPVVILADISCRLSRDEARVTSIRRAACAPSDWRDGRRWTCGATTSSKHGATRPKASAWRTSRRRAPAISLVVPAVGDGPY